jgi:hypothetical protein
MTLATDQIEAKAALVAQGGLDGLREWVYDSHKDIHGVKARWAMSWSAEECADWIVRHFVREWSEAFNEYVWNLRPEFRTAEW